MQEDTGQSSSTSPSSRDSLGPRLKSPLGDRLRRVAAARAQEVHLTLFLQQPETQETKGIFLPCWQAV